MRATEVTCVKAAGHCSRQNIITSASTVLPAILNVRLGAQREQQQLREGCFPEMMMQRGLEPPSNGTDSKKVDTGDAAQGPSEVPCGCTAAPCTLAESAAKCSQCWRSLWKGAGAPTRRNMHHTRRGTQHPGSMCDFPQVPWCLPPCVCTLQPCAGRPALGEARFRT